MLSKNLNNNQYFDNSYLVAINSINNLFSQIGLDEDHSRIYLACSQKPKCSITELSREVNINRSTLHSKLKIMSKSGVVTLLEENNKLLIQTNSLSFISQKITDLVETAKNTISNSFNQNQLYFVTEINLIFDVYNKLLNDLPSSDFYYINGNLNDWFSLNKKFFSKFVKERDAIVTKQKYKIKAIYDKGSKDANVMFDYDKFYKPIVNFDYKIIEDVDYLSNTVITNSKLIIHSIHTNQLIFTSNPFMISAFKLNFEILWNSLK
jgi:DNA-binding MarR family transcriptional regulator